MCGGEKGGGCVFVEGKVKHNPKLAAEPNKDFRRSDTVAKECAC